MKMNKKPPKEQTSKWLPRITGDYECEECRIVVEKPTPYCPYCGKFIDNYGETKGEYDGKHQTTSRQRTAPGF